MRARQRRSLADASNRNLVRQKAWAVREEGSGTVIMVAVIALLLMVFSLAQLPVRTLIEQARAEVAADQAAVAATNSLRGFNTGVPCEVAAFVSRQNGARLARCRIVENNVSVSVLLGSRIVAEATAGI